jgi:DNA-directed RNA polymerase subunit M/transcription elongation factor TFIIS
MTDNCNLTSKTVKETYPFTHNDIVPLPSFCYTSNTYNDLRRLTLIILGALLKKNEKFRLLEYDKQVKIMTKIERGIYNTTIDKCNTLRIPAVLCTTGFDTVYKTTSFHITSNLDPELVSNEQLIDNILSGTVVLEKLAACTSIELLPAKYKEIETYLADAKSVKLTKKVSNMYKCRNCHKNECEIRSIINRCLDEGTNLEVTCMNCAHKWFA